MKTPPTEAVFNRKKLSKICTYKTYVRAFNWFWSDNPIKVPFEGSIYAKTSHREYLSKWLENFIIRYVRKNGFLAQKVDNTPTRQVEEKYVPHGLTQMKLIQNITWKKKAHTTSGEPDIRSTINGRTVYWEVKIGKDRLSQQQKEFIKDAERAGAIVYIVKTVDEFLYLFDMLTKVK